MNTKVTIPTPISSIDFTHLMELFVLMKHPLIKGLVVKYDKKKMIEVSFLPDKEHTEEVVQESLIQLRKEIQNYAGNKQNFAN